jgi:hypothetical protein
VARRFFKIARIFNIIDVKNFLGGVKKGGKIWRGVVYWLIRRMVSFFYPLVGQNGRGVEFLYFG